MAVTMMKVLCIVAACMVVAAPYAEAALTCNVVVSKLAPCLDYLKEGGKVSVGCCKGVKGLNAAAKTTSEKKTACTCMKNAYKTVAGIKPEHALVLPNKCGVDIPYKISPSTDCSKVK